MQARPLRVGAWEATRIMSSHRTRRIAAVLTGATLAAFLGMAADAGPRSGDAELTLLSSTSNRGEIEPCG